MQLVEGVMEGVATVAVLVVAVVLGAAVTEAEAVVGVFVVVAGVVGVLVVVAGVVGILVVVGIEGVLAGVEVGVRVLAAGVVPRSWRRPRARASPMSSSPRQITSSSRALLVGI